MRKSSPRRSKLSRTAQFGQFAVRIPKPEALPEDYQSV